MERSPPEDIERPNRVGSPLLHRTISSSDLSYTSPLSHPRLWSETARTNSLSSGKLTEPLAPCPRKNSSNASLATLFAEHDSTLIPVKSWSQGEFFDDSGEVVESVKGLDSFEVPGVFLKEGLQLLKVSHKSRKRIQLKVDPANFKFTWRTVSKNKQYEFLVDDIRSYAARDKASVYREEMGISREFEKQWLSITYYNHSKNKLKTLHVITDTSHDLKKFLPVIENFKKLKDEISRNFLIDLSELDEVKRRIIAGKAEPIDKQTKQSLSFNDILKFSKRLNINLNSEYLERVFRLVQSSSHTTADGLNFDEFKTFVGLLKQRDDVTEIWDKHVGRNKTMLFNDFSRFLAVVQGEKHDKEQLHKLFKKFAFTGNDFWVEENLNSFLLSKYSSPLKDSHTKSGYFSHPLNEYYILSSHNTYLIGRQFAGDSSVEGYIKALQRGCRCVEVDIWNNDDDPHGEPIVNHGRTFTKGISLTNVIKTIKKYAFQASNFPVILSLEIHCSIEGQQKVVSILRGILGDLMVEQPINFGSTLPSPDALKNRILIKVKKTSPFSSIGVDETGKFVSTTSTTNGTSLSESAESGNIVRKGSLKLRRRTSTRKVVEDLSDLGVYVQGIKFRNFSLPESKTYNHCFSLSEKVVTSMIKEEVKLASLDKHNRKFFMRVYPSKFRLNSSNFLPLSYWAHGVQMVATNWQTYDLGQQLNESMFAAVQGKGYVLKPSVLRKPLLKSSMRKLFTNENFKTRFLIEVISAHQLPKPADCGSAINPYVAFEIIGANWIEWDQSSTVGATRIIPENGFNPTWNQVFSGLFESSTSLVFMRLTIQTSTSTKEVENSKEIGILVANLFDTKQGYRYFSLNDLCGEHLLYSSVFVRIEHKRV